MSKGRTHTTEVHGHSVNQQTDQRLHRETTTFLARTSKGSPSRGGPAVPTSTSTWVPTVLIYCLCVSLCDHDEDLTGAGTPTTLEEESCVHGSERETTLLDERTGKILQSVAGLRAAPGRCAVARSVAAPREELHDMLRRRELGPKCHCRSVSSRQARSQSASDGVDVWHKCHWRGVDTLEVLHVSMPPDQLVKFLIVRPVRRSATGAVRKVSVD